MSFFEELKRRNVIRVGIAYGVTAWILLQIADLVLDNIVAPDWIMHVLMLLVGLGFVVALIIAWAYELTPEGIKRESEVDRNESVTHHTAKRLDYITLAAVVLVIIFIVGDRLLPDSQPAKQTAQRTTGQTPAAQTQNPAAAPTASTDREPTAGNNLTLGVAVLPFTNLSDESSNAFFASGVHEDVLTQLSKIRELRVISRTSMLKIAEAGLDVRQIGQQLGISHVLEGSVRRAGNQVRVTVQLIDAQTDEHLWADNFDRTLDDIFAIQSEIARTIAQQLKTELTAAEIEAIADIPTTSTEAYDLYLQAREKERTWSGPNQLEEMQPLLEQALVLDPEFAEAHLMLARAFGRLYWLGADTDGSYRARAQSITDDIVARWPDSLQSNLAQLYFHYLIERDYRRALEFAEPALVQQPGNVSLLLFMSAAHKRLLQFDQGLSLILKAESLDPMHQAVATEVVFHLQGTGQYSEAVEKARDNFRRFPQDYVSVGILAGLELQLLGNVDEHLRLYQMSRQLVPGYQSISMNSEIMLMTPANMDQRIAEIRTMMPAGDPVIRYMMDFRIARAYNIAGRKNESQALAANTLKAIQQWLADGNALPGNTPEVDAANLAFLACLADDRAAFETFRARHSTLVPREFGTRLISQITLALAMAECGQTQPAWTLMSAAVDSVPMGITAWDIALDPEYKHYFSALPQYQKIVAPLKPGQLPPGLPRS